MKKILLTILYLILLSSIAFATPFVDVDITSGNLITKYDTKIIGSINVKNSSELYSPELYYVATLSQLIPISEGSKITTSSPYCEFEPIKFEIGAHEEKTLYFDYRLPENLPTNEYALSIMLYSDTTTISNVPQIIFLGNIVGQEETLLSNSSHYWSIDERKIKPDTGPNYPIGLTPIGGMELTSTFTDDITVTPEFTVYKRLKTYEGTPLKIVKGSPITIKADETKEIEIEFPTFTEPESYEILVKFLNQEDKPVSPEFSFRYVLSGPSAKILSTNASYDANTDSIDVDINVIGPADASTLKNCSIIYKIYNMADSSLIKEETKTLTLTTQETLIEEKLVGIDTTDKIKIETSIEYNGKKLDSNSITMNLKKTVKSDTEQFTDLVGTKYYEAVKILNGLGILNGYPDGTFKPDNNITRAEFTVIATKLAKIDSGDIKSGLPFSDVTTEHWAKDFIILAYENNIISGYPDGTFKADNNVTYQEVLTILLNVMNYKEEINSVILTWPENYIKYAEYLNMMKNVDNIDYVSPATRGNVALLTMEAYIKLKEI